MPAFVISLPVGGNQAKENEVIAFLEACTSHGIILLPDIYNLTRDHPAALALRQQTSALALLAPHHPRAAKWILHSLGVRASIKAFDSRQNFSAHETAGKLLASLPLYPGKSQALIFSQELPERWYPVLDYDRCAGCGQCREFCIFGVYGKKDDGTVFVGNPDNCKPGCPACARVCPAGAIIFPRCRTDEAVAGAEQGALPGGDITAARAFAAEHLRVYESKTDSSEQTGGDEFDDLIDELEKLENNQP